MHTEFPNLVLCKIVGASLAWHCTLLVALLLLSRNRGSYGIQSVRNAKRACCSTAAALPSLQPVRQAFTMANNVIQPAGFHHTGSSGFFISENDQMGMMLLKSKHVSTHLSNATMHRTALSKDAAFVKRTKIQQEKKSYTLAIELCCHFYLTLALYL